MVGTSAMVAGGQVPWVTSPATCPASHTPMPAVAIAARRTASTRSDAVSSARPDRGGQDDIGVWSRTLPTTLHNGLIRTSVRGWQEALIGEEQVLLDRVQDELDHVGGGLSDLPQGAADVVTGPGRDVRAF